MLIAHGLLPDLVSQLSSYSLFGIAPIWWDQNEGQFKVKKSAITCIGSVITFQLGLVLIVHDLYRQYQLAANTNAGDSSSSSTSGIERAYNRTQRISCALLLFMVAIIHCRNMRSAHAIVAFFNGMIAFEQKYTGRLRLPTDWKGKITKYFCLLVRLFNNIGPLLISILVVVSEPSSPLNIVAFLQTSQTTAASSSSTYSSSSSELGDANGGNDLSSSTSSGITIITSNQMVQKFITGTVTALLNMMIWYMVVNIRGFWTCGQILIGCYGIRSALNLYSSIMTRGKLLRITKEKIQEALIYREIQLLTTLFNEVHGNSIFVILLLLSSLLQTISLYLYVRFVATMTSSYFFFVLSSWTWTSRLFVAYMVFDGIFIVFVVFGCCSEVYVQSVQVKVHLQCNDVFQRSEWFTQFFLSCSTIKLKCGSTNFISEGQFGTASRNSTATSFNPSSEMMMANGNAATCSVVVGGKMGNVVNNGSNSNCNVVCGNGSSSSVSSLTLQSGGLFDMGA